MRFRKCDEGVDLTTGRESLKPAEGQTKVLGFRLKVKSNIHVYCFDLQLVLYIFLD